MFLQRNFFFYLFTSFLCTAVQKSIENQNVTESSGAVWKIATCIRISLHRRLLFFMCPSGNQNFSTVEKHQCEHVLRDFLLPKLSPHVRDKSITLKNLKTIVTTAEKINKGAHTYGGPALRCADYGSGFMCFSAHSFIQIAKEIHTKLFFVNLLRSCSDRSGN